MGLSRSALALVLCKELRTEYGLPAYIFRKKLYPGGSNIRGVAPTVPSQVLKSDLKMPERIRTYDEAAVLVGNEKTLADQERLWRKVKQIDPTCLQKMSTPFPWRHGLITAPAHHEPLGASPVPFSAQAGQADDHDEQRPAQHRELPGDLQPASGRILRPLGLLLQSQRPGKFHSGRPEDQPAAHRARRCRANGRKAGQRPEIRQTGQPIYVYHDERSSRVYIGAFNSPQDPAAGALRNYLIQNAYNMSNKNYIDPVTRKPRGRAATDTMIVPALALTDVNVLKTKIKQ